MITGDFAAVAVALYVAHHVGDYWVQRNVDAQHKADPTRDGQLHCLHHVLTYLATQVALVTVVTWVLHLDTSPLGLTLALLVSGGTHYLADRRAPLARIASWIPGKADFLKLGAPREHVSAPWVTEPYGATQLIQLDNPQLATGAWALDQSWHIFWGVFVAALLMVGVR